MRNVFVYGDSISMQYGYPLKELLNDRGVAYERFGGGNSCDLADVLRIRKGEPCQVEIEEYKTNLKHITEVACRIYEGVVFCNSTPVDDKRHNKTEE